MQPGVCAQLNYRGGAQGKRYCVVALDIAHPYRELPLCMPVGAGINVDIQTSVVVKAPKRLLHATMQ